ncbi:MAG TPA: HlyD family efflux transporter periplasmic adaptor subunit [Planctomycetaceae bacterium]|nr:HlyD family efflux transporter periplasmic adaptor subunit [Planctomycetaceae bacterium]
MVQATTVQNARQRILQMAREIEQLAQSGGPPEQFFQRFLQLLMSALGSRAGVVWMLGNGGMLNRFCEINLAETNLHENPDALRLNQRLLVEVVSDGQARSYNSDDDRGVEIPSQHHIILAPLQNGTESVGVVEMFQRQDCPRDARPGYLQFVEQMCGYASKYLERPRELPAPASPRGDGFLDEFAAFVLSLQRSLRMKEVAAIAANDGRLLLRCDRLSLAVQRGRKVVVQAISGQDAVNQRANLVSAMRRLAHQVISTGEPVIYTGKVENLAPQVEEPLAAFVQESGSRMVAIVPLFETIQIDTTPGDKPDAPPAERRQRPLGCLLAEQVKDSEPPVQFRERIDLIADHVAAALNNARSHQQVFLLPVWTALGRSVEWFHGRKLLKTLAILGIVGALAGSLALIPWDYRVSGQGRLMPVVQGQVFAPNDGEVKAIFVQGGQRVVAGQPLVELWNDDLQEMLTTTRNELEEKLESLPAIESARRAARDRDEEFRLSGQMRETETQIAGLQARLNRFEQRAAELTVTSPIDGVVATFQLEQKLMGRPVRRGEILMEVMDDTGEWRLELEVPEDRLGHMARAQEALGRDDLRIEYVLATSAESTYECRLSEIATRPASSAENTSIVEVFAAIDRDQRPPHPRIGSDVRAKIHCGKKSLGYVLFGDVIEFFQRHFWL